MPDRSPRGWTAIDLLRFACALLVLAHHYGAALVLHPNPAAAAALNGAQLPSGLAPWTSFGWVGVEVFFVISGYVIAASADGAPPGIFLRRRAQRLLPAAWACASLSFAILWAVAAMPTQVLAAQWLRAVAFWPIGQTIDPSYWTLGIEAAFYLMVAAILGGGADPARLERLACGIGTASAIFWLAQSGGLMHERFLQLLLLAHGVFFAAGILLHAAHRDGLSVPRAVGLAAFLSAGVLEIAAHSREMATSLGVSPTPAAPVAAFAAGVAVIAMCRRLQPLLGWTRGYAVTLGLMTYPLYLLHQQIGAACAGLFASAGLPAGLGLVTAIPLILALSWVVVRYVEPCLRPWIGEVLTARRGPRPDIRPSASPSAG